MQNQTLICPVCLNEFNNRDRIPKIIIACGHTVCLECLTSMLRFSNNPKCPCDNILLPFANRSIEKFPTNYIVIQSLEGKVAKEICEEHQEEKTLACFTNRSRICYDCALFDQHKGHDIKPFKKIKPHLEAKEQQLETALRTIDEHYKEANETIQETQNSIEKTIKHRFGELQQMLLTKELALLHESKCFFDHQKNQMINSFGTNSTLRRDLMERISKYKKIFQNEDFFHLIDEDVELITSELSSEALRMNIKHLNEKLDVSVKTLDERLSGLVQTLYKVRLQTQILSKGCLEYFEKYKGHPFGFSLEHYHLNHIQTSLQFIFRGEILTISPQINEIKEAVIDLDILKDTNKIVFKINESELKQEDTIALQYIWQFMKRPLSIKIICESQDATNNALTQVLSSISIIKNEIEEFSLNLEHCRLIGDVGILPLMEKIIPGMSSLKILSLWLHGTEITNKSLLAFPSHMKVIKSLLSIELNFANTSITDKGVVPLFCPMPSAERYYLNLRGTNVTDISLKEFSTKTLPSMDR